MNKIEFYRNQILEELNPGDWEKNKKHVDEVLMRLLGEAEIANRSSEGYRPIESISELKTGMVVRHKSGGKSYIVNSNYGDRATATNIADITNVNEWDVLGQ